MDIHRHLCAGVVLAALLGAPGAASGFATGHAFELPHRVEVDLDGAGGVQVAWRGEVVARIELVFSTASAARGLDVADGAELPQQDLLDVPLSEGQAGGDPGVDDDFDGRIDEDPFDGLDNDGDGRRDEDFAAIGHQMRVSHADLDGAGLPRAHLRTRWSHWPYFHVDDVLFWNAQLEGIVPGGSPAAKVETIYELKMADEDLEPHATLGRVTSRHVTFPYLQVEGLGGRRLYLALVRLDGLEAAVLPDDGGVVWEDATDPSWPLALVTAPTRDALEFSVGQALLTYRSADEGPPTWTVPPLCARCQQTSRLQAELHIAAEGPQLTVTLRTTGHDEHLQVSAEGVSVAGVVLARYRVRSNAAAAVYQLPLQSGDARQILAAAAEHRPALSMVLRNGLTVTPSDVEMDVDRGLLARAAEREPEPDFPQHLAPRLLQTWPNPFHETTTIRYEVPSTLGEAFDFEPDDERAQRLDLKAEPPFGVNPTVRVRIYNVSGQLIRILDERVRSVGHHSVSWDGTDDQGTPVAAGAYYVNVEMGDYRVTRRVLRLKP
jgi:hypothetical protein